MPSSHSFGMTLHVTLEWIHNPISGIISFFSYIFSNIFSDLLICRTSKRTWVNLFTGKCRSMKRRFMPKSKPGLLALPLRRCELKSSRVSASMDAGSPYASYLARPASVICALPSFRLNFPPAVDHSLHSSQRSIALPLVALLLRSRLVAELRARMS